MGLLDTTDGPRDLDGLTTGELVRLHRAVVAVIGDGALTGGMAWEALNNIAGAPDRPVVIVINDNGRSYSPTIGGLASHLAALRTARGYEKFLASAKETLTTTPVVGPALYSALHGAKKGLKDIITPQGMFEDLGLKYVGPIDGHDIEAMENALRMARAFGGPVAVHCITTKGQGYRQAEDDRIDHFHAVRVIDPATGRPSRPGGRSWTSVFASELVTIGEDRPDVVAITAAMLHPTGRTSSSRPSPTGCSTSGSPNSTRSPRRRAWPWAGRTRWWRSTPPSSTGRSTSSSWTSRCTARLVVTVEDGGRAGGVGSAVAQALQAADVTTPVRSFGIPPRFLEHGKRADILKDCGLTAHQLFLAVVERIAVPEEITPYHEEDARPAAARANRKVNR